MPLESLFSLQIERHTIASLLKHPQIFPDIDLFLSEDDFVNNSHRTIYCVIKSLLSQGEKLDKVIVAQKIKNLGVTFKEDLDIFDYLDSLSSSQITEKAGINACKELVKLRVRREICGASDKIKAYVLENGNASIDEIIANSDKIYNDQISSYHIEEEPRDLFDGLLELINERANNPQDDVGLLTPYEEFNQLFGGLRSGNGIYSIASRPGGGKSTFLINMACGVTLCNENTIALYLDTEMRRDVSQFRMASVISQVPMWFLETGNWKRKQEFVDKLKVSVPEFDRFKNKVFHLKVGNRPIEEICSISRRWFYKNIGRNSGKKLFLIYDYIKYTGEKVSNNWAEHQILGEKVNRLNDLSEQLSCPIFVAIQLNRSAEDGRDDSAAISASDRLQHFACFTSIFRKKRLDEIEDEGLEFGSHKLIPLKTRFQGKQAAGQHNLVNISVGKEKPKYKEQFINYDINEFRVTEKGTLKDIMATKREQYDLSKEVNETDGIL